MRIERLSIELTQRCGKGCWFCYNHSNPSGEDAWSADELVAFAADCHAHGTQAVSFGGGEPLQFAGVFEVLKRLDGTLFRSLTTNGLLLTDEVLERLCDARPDKVHISIHFPDRPAEVERVIGQVHQLAHASVTSGINLLVARGNLAAAETAARQVRESGISNERIVYLPMRKSDTPTPEQVAQVAGNEPFQSMTCLSACAASPRFCSIDWQRTVAWCSYTAERRPLAELTHRGLTAALDGLGLAFCGGTDEAPTLYSLATATMSKSITIGIGNE